MSEKRFKLSAAVYVLLINADNVFLLRRFNTGWSDGLYTVPAGHIDGNEPLSAAMCREAKEEAGVTLKSDDVRFVHAMHRKDGTGEKREYADFFFTAHKWIGEPYNAEPSTCDDGRWFPMTDLPHNLLPHVRQVIEDYKTDKKCSEIGW